MAAQTAPFSIRLRERITFVCQQPGNTNACPTQASSNANQQTASSSVSLTDEHFLSILPASQRADIHNLVPPRLDDISWIENELNVERLRTIQPLLWLVGRPMPPRPLHHQISLGRQVVVTEQMDMHLVWTTGRMYLKPLPRFLLEPQFWTRFLSCAQNCACVVANGKAQTPPAAASNFSNSTASTHQQAFVECRQHKLRKIALGFLFSYVALISHESDLGMAKEKFLLPAEVDWPYWTSFVRELSPEHIYPDIDDRFVYGELRLSRLNKIYTLTKRPFLRGYVYSWQQYSSFFGEYLGLLTGVIVYIAIILTAMQVGLATDQLQNSQAFMNASYGFTVFSILGPLIVIAFMVLVFLCLLCINCIKTVTFHKKRMAIARPAPSRY
ncbi:uncharacterized protein HMPREF1541_10732 [Cyphellophora europaea CBS 101466]|uniref:Uncharacterized protein n=1 Tax=Cyphellophora europaea (strain CBS 101466) TaxID=1220924 RepID=W2S651_CYPE1|nr:uncharacterized protein HMPREF1541_10732 [Cyphellophora europaea CBS 101466]ETN44182.1 hypothetical protein HMPREF1541_10732 [Cyphellophora europaea CBS 101466]